MACSTAPPALLICFPTVHVGSLYSRTGFGRLTAAAPIRKFPAIKVRSPAFGKIKAEVRGGRARGGRPHGLYHIALLAERNPVNHAFDWGGMVERSHTGNDPDSLVPYQLANKRTERSSRAYPYRAGSMCLKHFRESLTRKPSKDLIAEHRRTA